MKIGARKGLIRIKGWLNGLFRNEKVKKLYEPKNLVAGSFPACRQAGSQKVLNIPDRKSENQYDRMAKGEYLSPGWKDLISPYRLKRIYYER